MEKSTLRSLSTLRPYQSECVERLRSGFRAGRRALLLVAPTGAGKTVMFSHMTENAVSRGNRVLILVHRQELIDQVQRAVAHLPHGLIAEGRMTNRAAHVQVASVQTVANRLDAVATPDLIVVDECHHAAAATWQAVLARWPQAWRLGVTATPERLDGQGLRGLFEQIIHGPTVPELQDLGFLCRTRYFAPGGIDASGLKTRAGDYVMADGERAGRRIIGDVVATYQRLNAGRAVAFCCTVAHAEEQAAAFGNRWRCIHGGLTKDARREMVAAFVAGDLDGLTSVDVISEGFDLPAIEAAILLRPTQSLAMHLQQIGRALRPYPGKDAALIIDHVGNIQRHGYAEDERAWSLDGEEGRSKKSVDMGKRCDACYFLNPRGADVCGDCGAPLTTEPAEIERVAAPMVELTREQRASVDIRARVREAIDGLGLRLPLKLKQWRDVAERLGYKRGWAWHQFQSQKLKLGS